MYHLIYNRRGKKINMRRKGHDGDDAIRRLCNQYGWTRAIRLVDADTRGHLWVEACIDTNGSCSVSTLDFDFLLRAFAAQED